MSRNLKDRKESSVQISGGQVFLAVQLRPRGEDMYGLLKEQHRRQCAGADMEVVGGVHLKEQGGGPVCGCWGALGSHWGILSEGAR